MESLSELIDKKILENGESDVFFTLKKRGHFDFHLYKDDRLNLNTIIEGPEKFEEQEALAFLPQFLNGLEPFYLDSSHINVELSNGQRMIIDHSSIDELNLHHYDVRIQSLSKQESPTKYTNVLAQIVNQLYGLHIDPRPYEHGEDYPNPFVKNQNPEKGLLVSCTSGLEHGTIYEQEAFDVFWRLQLQGKLRKDEVKALRKYDKCLIEEMPTVSQEKGILLQQGGNKTSSNFCNFLENLPDQVIRIMAYYGGLDTVLVLSNMKTVDDDIFERAGPPYIQFLSSEYEKKNCDAYIDHAWNLYHLLTGIPLEDARAALDKEFE